MLVPSVASAITELRTQFGDAAISFDEDGSGGAYTTVAGVELPSPPYKSPTWLSFHIPFTYPAAEVYPVFVRPDLRDDGYVNPAIRASVWRNAPATQLSLRIINNQRNADVETALQKVLKVIAWLRNPK